MAVLRLFALLLHTLKLAIYTSTYPSLLKLTLVEEGGLCLAPECQCVGSVNAWVLFITGAPVARATKKKKPTEKKRDRIKKGGWKGRMKKEKKKRERKENNQKMHPIMCGFRKNAKDSFNSSSFKTTIAEQINNISCFLKFHKQHHVFNRLEF